MDVLTLDDVAGQATEVRWEVVTPGLAVIGTIDVSADSSAVIENNANRPVKRQLSGLVLPPATVAEIDPFRDRLRPVWLVADPVSESVLEFPLGVFTFASLARREARYSAAGGSEGDGNMGDLLIAFDQPLDRSVTYPAGTPIRDAMVEQAVEAGVLIHNIEDTGKTLGSPLSWVVGRDTRLRVVNDLAALAGFYCLGPQTKVLCADLTWRPVNDLYVGDKIVGFDEATTARQNFREAEVTSIGGAVLDSYEVTTRYGTTLASADHRWLVARKVPRSNGRWARRWVATADLTIGDEIVSFGAPWQRDDSHEGGYLAGFLDGEGSVSGKRVQMAQLPGEVLDRVQAALDARQVPYTGRKHPSSGVVNLRLTGGRYEAMRLLGTVRPTRLLAKAHQLWEGTATWSVVGGNGGDWRAPVLGLRHVGPQRVVTIGTSTGTLVADGLLSHNSPWFDNEGVFVGRAVPELGSAPADFDYDSHPRIYDGSIVLTDDALSAPNRYLVVDTAATENPISAFYDVPAHAPHSIANRGFPVVKLIEMQGLASTQAALEAARAAALTDTAAFAWAEVQTVPEPRMDTWNVVLFGNLLAGPSTGELWRVQSWRLTLAPGGPMAQSWRRLL